MKAIIGISLICSFLLSVPTLAQPSKWEMVGLIGFTSIGRQSPTSLVATTTHGYLYSSNDNGTRWQRRELDDTLCLRDIAFRDSLNVVVLGGHSRVLRSHDGGVHWSYLGISDPLANLTAVAYPGSDTVFVADSVGRIWRSTDDGAHWESQTTADHLALHRLCFISSRIGVAVGDNETVFRTNDAGEHWQRILLPTTDTMLHNLYGVDFRGADSGVIVGFGLYLCTTDGGAHWVRHTLDLSIYAQLTAVRIIDGRHFFAFGPEGQIYLSSDFGETIHVSLFDNTTQYGSIRAAIYDPIYGGFAVGDEALITRATSADCSQWVALNQIESRGPIESAPGHTLHCGTYLFSTSTDGGIFWNGNSVYLPGSKEIEDYMFAMHFVSPNNGFLINQTNYDWIRTSDGGLTWQLPTFANNFPIPRSTTGGYTLSSFCDTDHGFVAGDTIITRTSDNGDTWTSSTITYDRSSPFTAIATPSAWGILDLQSISRMVGFATLNVADWLSKPQPGTHYVYHSLLYKTNDGGDHWLVLPTAPATPRTRHIAFANELRGILACDSGAIYRTEDGGKTWVRSQLGPVSCTISALRYMNDSVAFASTTEQGILSSSDGGRTWQREHLPHPDVYPEPIYCSAFVFPDSTTVLAVAAQPTGAGFFRKELGNKSAGAKIEYTGSPLQYLYVRLFPNPCSGLLNVELDGTYVATNGILHAEVHDLLGRQILDLSTEAQQHNDGEISRFSCDLHRLPNGVYTLRYSIGEYSFARRFVLVK